MVMVGGGSGPKGGVWGRVEDGDEEDLGLALRSSYSLAQSRAAAGLTHPSLTSRKKSEPEPFSSPDLSLGHKAGKAHKSCKVGRSSSQAASTDSYTAFKTQPQVVSPTKPPVTEEAALSNLITQTGAASSGRKSDLPKVTLCGLNSFLLALCPHVSLNGLPRVTLKLHQVV